MLLHLRSAICTTIATVSFVCFSACQAPPRESAESAQAERAEEIATLDRLTTLDTLFPQASERALYDAQGPATERGMRSYTFALKRQPGIDISRHFHIITVTWARSGTVEKPGQADRGASSTGGPGGSVVEHTVSTPDGNYELRVAQGELLPNAAKTTSPDVVRLSQRLVDKYSELEPR